MGNFICDHMHSLEHEEQATLTKMLVRAEGVLHPGDIFCKEQDDWRALKHCYPELHDTCSSGNASRGIKLRNSA